MEINSKDTTKLIIFSDIHYGPVNSGYNDDGIKRKLTQYALPLIDELKKQINIIKPDAVINLGDLIEDVRDHEADIANLKYIWHYLNDISVPFYSVAGNHDLRTLSRSEVELIMGYQSSTFSKNVGGYHLVFLGLNSRTDVCDAEGGILKTRVLSSADLKWLENDLKNNFLPCLVFIHYGVAEDRMEGNFWFGGSDFKREAALLENRAELKSILNKGKNIVAVFSGHQHWTKKIVENNIPYYIIGSLTEDIKGDGVPDGIWFEVSLKNGNISKLIKHHLTL